MRFSWNRCFARFMDWGIFYFIGVLLSLMLPVEFDDRFYFTFALETPFLWLPVEALFVSLWATTPGKALFGIEVRSLEGNKLTFLQSLKQSLFFGKRPGVVSITTIRKWRYFAALIVALGCGSTLFLGKDLTEAAVHFERQMVGDWIQYASDDGRFTVQFPKKPEVASLSYEIPNSDQSLEMNELKAKKDVIFSVSYVELPRKWRIFSAGTLLKGAMEVVHNHTPGAEILSKKRVTHKSYPAMDFQMKEGENQIEGRLILVGSTLYKLTVTYPPDTVKEQQHEAFLNSFELKN